MKQAILLFISATLSTFAFGQRQSTRTTHASATTTAARTTAAGDVVTLKNFSSTDSITVYSYGADSGYVTGPNALGDMGFAERYDISGSDSTRSVTVIGVMAQFGGQVSASSTKTINFKVWGLSPQVAITADLAYNNFPMNGLDTLTVPVTNLGIGTTVDTMKSYFFPHPTDTIQGSFFVGYDMAAYDFSTVTDTFGLYSTLNGARTAPYFVIDTVINEEAADTAYITVINVQNATLWSDNVWHENYTQNDSIKNNLAVFPIVKIGVPTGISSVTKNSLTFFGNYPNPAVDYTNVKYSLSKNADVTLKLMDMQGRMLNTVEMKSQGMGEHIIVLPVGNLATGNYIYSIVTSNGDAIGSQMSVVR